MPAKTMNKRMLRKPYNEWKRLIVPTIYFIAVIYYLELFFKVYCFHEVTLQGAVFTLLFTIPVAVVFGWICGSSKNGKGGRRILCCTALIALWVGAQTVYFHMFKTFLTIFSITKMSMVAGAFGNMAAGELYKNWFPILMIALPVVVTFLVHTRIMPNADVPKHGRRKWLFLAIGTYLCAVLITLFSGSGVVSMRYLYLKAAAPELEVRNFGIFTQTQLEIRRVLFGILPDAVDFRVAQRLETDLHSPTRGDSGHPGKAPGNYDRARYNVMEIDFEALKDQAERDENVMMMDMHDYFSTLEPTKKNDWTGYFAGKNLVWIVAEGFCSLAVDPQRTPTLYQMTQQGFQFNQFYTPLWGVSTSDGEYVTTTGLIPKPGVWSYSESSDNYMPFAFGNQFRQLGYTAQAYHDFEYTYYDRNLSYPNMGYDYYGLGNGLELEEVWPPSDLEMMEKIVPQFVDEAQFMVYCLTVSGHLNYSYEENAMARRHWDTVADLPYSDAVKAYLASQVELELAVKSLVEQLQAVGKLEDTVIVISGDHYPYGLNDEQYSELLGHEVDPVFEIYESSLILWNSEMTNPVPVDKYCSSLDIMPTLSNLFGLMYDSRLMAGHDILSDTPGLVIFSDYSFLSETDRYNAKENLFVMADGSEADKEYIEGRIGLVQNQFAYSAAILENDYYRILFEPPQDA